MAVSHKEHDVSQHVSLSHSQDVSHHVCAGLHSIIAHGEQTADKDKQGDRCCGRTHLGLALSASISVVPDQYPSSGSAEPGRSELDSSSRVEVMKCCMM